MFPFSLNQSGKTPFICMYIKDFLLDIANGFIKTIEITFAEVVFN